MNSCADLGPIIDALRQWRDADAATIAAGPVTVGLLRREELLQRADDLVSEIWRHPDAPDVAGRLVELRGILAEGPTLPV